MHNPQTELCTSFDLILGSMHVDHHITLNPHFPFGIRIEGDIDAQLQKQRQVDIDGINIDQLVDRY